jgi:hypothetical protein
MHRLRYVEYLVLIDVHRVPENLRDLMERLVLGRESRALYTILLTNKRPNAEFMENIDARV